MPKLSSTFGLQELGTLLIRGYAYQETYSLLGINLLPTLKTLKTQSLNPADTVQNLQVITPCVVK